MPNGKGKKNSNWKGGRRKHSSGYIQVLQHGHSRANPKGYVFEHILIAEKALGKPLPPGAVVHHHSVKNDNTQLVICENQAYHMLLHQCIRALKACGHAGWRKCAYCKQYDKPENLIIRICQSPHHTNCKNIYNQKQKERLINELR